MWGGTFPDTRDLDAHGGGSYARAASGGGWGWETADIGFEPENVGIGYHGDLHGAVAGEDLEGDECRQRYRSVGCHSGYGQDLSNTMKAAVLYAMLPADVQVRVLGERAQLGRDPSEGDGGALRERQEPDQKHRREQA